MRSFHAKSATVALVLAMAGACGDDETPPGAGPGDEPEAPPPELAEAAGIEEPSSAWPTDTTDLLASLEEVGSVETCRARLREGMPVELAEAMADIGYEQVLDDVCAGLVAVRDESVEGCDALSVSALRQGCRRRLAIVAGRPDACPEAAAIDGRDPVCIAWARRDPGMCRAAAPPERPRCRAVLTNDAEECGRLLPGDRERCRAEVQRYAAALGNERTESEAGDVAPVFRLEAQRMLEGAPAGDPVAIERDVLGRGVHLAAEGCRYRLSLRDPTGELPSPVSFTDRPARAQVQLDVAPGAETPHEIPLGPSSAGLTVTLPGVGEANSISGATGKVTLTAWSTEHGGEIAGSVEADMTLTPGRVTVEGEFRTFVRDVDPLGEACGGAEGDDDE